MEYTITSKDKDYGVFLVGTINEDAELPFQNLLKELSGAAKVTFHFGKIKSINSLGVRVWVGFLRAVEENREILFSQCMPEIIMQINMIPSFLGKAKIESFFINYVCETCSKQKTELVYRKDIPPNSLPEIPKCGQADCDMQTEELEDEYFVFLNR